jgi:hypothetical protein
MKKLPVSLTLLSLVLMFSSCSAVEGIFKAGVWVGVLIVVGIIALIVWLASRGAGK